MAAAGGAALFWQVVIALGTVAYSMAQQPDIDQSDKGVNVTKRGAQNPKSVLYGRSFVPGTCIYSNVKDNSTNIMLQVFDLGIGKATAIHQVYIEQKGVLDQEYHILTDPTKANDGFFGNKSYSIDGITPVPYKGGLTTGFRDQCILQFRSGNASERALEMAIKESDGEWTTNHRGDSVVQVAVRSERITDGDGIAIVSDKYKLVADISGIQVYDPRDGVTKWTDNAACCILDYLTNKEYGIGIGTEYIDLNSFANMANFCDANKLKINGWVNTGETYGKVLEQLLSSCDGSLVVENGKLVLKIATTGVSVRSFDESNIVGGLVVTENSGSNYYNVVSVKYRSFQNKYEQDTYVIPANQNTDPIIARDGFVKTKSIDMPFTVDGYVNNSNGTVKIDGAIKWMANRAYMRSRYQKQVQFKTDLISNPLKVNDIISVSHDLYNLTDYKFIVTAVTCELKGDNFGIGSIKAIAYHPDLYLSDLDGWTGKPTKPVTPPSPVTGLQFTTQNTDGMSYFGKLFWVSSFFSNTRRFEVEYKLSSRTDWTYLGNTEATEYLINGLSSDRYDFRVRVKDTWLGASTWTVLTNVQIGSVITLPYVRGVVATSATDSLDFSFKWDDMSNYDCQTIDPSSPNRPISGKVRDIFKHYRVDVYHLQSGSWALKNKYTTSSTNFTYSFGENQKNGLNRNVRFVVYIVAKTNDISPYNNLSGLNMNNPQMPLTPITQARGQLQVYQITWNNPTQADYDATEIHISTTSNFTPSSTTKYADISGGSFVYTMPDTTVRYIKIGSYDRFGRDGIVYSAQERLEAVSIDDLLPDEPDKLSDLRDPNVVVTESGTWIKNVSSSNDKKTAGLGLFTDNGKSQFIVAADELIVSAGGHAKWVNTTSYAVGDRCFYGTYPNQGMYEAKIANRNVYPTNTTYWRLINANVDQAAFYVDSATGSLYARNAVIKDLTTSNILTGSLTGVELSASSNLTVGQGNQVVRVSGTDANYRLWAGNQVGGSANFSVDKNGVLRATNAIISGSGTFSGNIYANNGSFNGTIRSSDAVITGTVTANAGVMNNVVIRDTCDIQGTLSANQIEGDIVSTKVFNIPETKKYAQDQWINLYSFSYGTSVIDRYVSMPNVLIKGQMNDPDVPSYREQMPTVLVRCLVGGTVVNEYTVIMSRIITSSNPSGGDSAWYMGSVSASMSKYVGRSSGVMTIQAKAGNSRGFPVEVIVENQQAIAMLLPSGKAF